MTTSGKLLRNFFTHKDFLPPAEEWPGTLFSPLQILFCLFIAGLLLFACFRCAKLSKKTLKKIFVTLWAIMVVAEPVIFLWEALAGETVHFEWNSKLPFWPCSIYLYALPFAIFGNGNVKRAACGYLCTLGLLGGVINFVYPATFISRYSCISFAGLYSLSFHCCMVFTAVTMLLSGYHSFRHVKKLSEVLLPLVPVLIVSVPSIIINCTIAGSDYMFFKMESFFFAPIGAATPDWISILLTYTIYAMIHCIPYLPSYLVNRRHTGIETNPVPDEVLCEEPDKVPSEEARVQ